jgi:DNA-binding MarR family transcriptional regulator
MREFATEKLKRFNYLSGEIEAVYHEAALKFSLSDSAMLVLYAICNNGESCLLSDIIHLSGASKQTINSALRKLEAEGIVRLEAVNGKKKNVAHRACRQIGHDDGECFEFQES